MGCVLSAQQSSLMFLDRYYSGVALSFACQVETKVTYKP